MTITIKEPLTTRTSLLIGGALSALWLVLGFVSDDTTYHLAPLLVTAIPASLYAMETHEPAMTRVLQLILVGALAAVAVIGILAVAGNLDGPTLLPFGGAVTESLVAAGGGAAIAAVIGLIRTTAADEH